MVAAPHDNNLVAKVDVEGAEWFVFDQTSDACLQRFRTITVEIHNMCMGPPHMSGLINMVIGNPIRGA